MSQQRLAPMLHWCERQGEWLILPVDVDGRGRRIGECPYCARLIHEEEPPGPPPRRPRRDAGMWS